MSNRTLIEINHDRAHDIDRALEFKSTLYRYLCSGSSDDADLLEMFGVKVIAMRHHADNFHIPNGTPGFPLKAPADGEGS